MANEEKRAAAQGALCTATGRTRAARSPRRRQGGNARLSGWVHRVRDHGGLLFIDLRDHYGMTQVVADPDSPAFKAAESVRSEWVIRVDGHVRERPEGTVNPELPTGRGRAVRVRDRGAVGGQGAAGSGVRRARLPRGPAAHLSLSGSAARDPARQHHEAVRDHRLDSAAHDARPASSSSQRRSSTASSPEGARDFLVPSRIHGGKFYALPQAPQQYKQLVMISGFDRYFQIAPCFRDEDPRADRLPGEFYQLDVEMSFVEQADVFAAMEPVPARAWP